MPPAGHGKPLDAREVELQRAWVQQGAKFAKPLVVREASATGAARAIENQKSKIKNPIDNFILARLEREGLKPSPEADRYALGRRVALDLTGLPPTVAEIEAFVKDSDPQAYEKFVDRMLAKESYVSIGRVPVAGPCSVRGLGRLRRRSGTHDLRVIAIGSSRRSTKTCRSISSRSNNSRATCCRIRPRTNSSRRPFIGTR